MKNLKLLVFVSISIIFSTILFADVPDYINYQGRVYSPPGSSTPVPDSSGNTITVRIYDAEIGGVLLYQQDIYNVTTKNGLFSISIGPLRGQLDFTQPYWMSIEFNYDGEMSPRQPLLSAPYAERAHYVDEVNNTTRIYGPVHITGSVATGEAVLTVTNTAGTGIVGFTEAGNQVAGVAGYSYSSNSETAGVYGYAISGIGVYGESIYTDSAGVQGENLNGVGIRGRGLTGVAAEAEDVHQIGIVASNRDSNGVALKVPSGKSEFYGSITINAIDSYLGSLNVFNDASTGYGAYIQNTVGSALYLHSNSQNIPTLKVDSPETNGIEVNSTGLDKKAIYGENPDNLGVLGKGAIGVSGFGYYTGVSGTATYSNGVGVYGSNTSTAAATGIGVKGEVWGAYSYGMYGINYYNGTGTEYTVGVFGQSFASPYGAGVKGDGFYGVYGTSQMPDGYGVYASVTSTTDALKAENFDATGSAIHCVNPDADGTNSGASLFVEGKIKITGTTGGVVDSPVNEVSVPAGTNPSLTVNNNLCGNPADYFVFLTPVDSIPSGVTWYVTKQNGSFVINVNGTLTNNTRFDYLIVNR